jgi:FkbM family methyltransferase
MKLRDLPGVLRFVLNHPLNRDHRVRALIRFARRQLGSRLAPGPVVVDFVENSRLLVRPGMAGATGNVYAGLHDFEEMSFVLHALRPGDTFIDAGANVGSYTVLASAVAGADCLAIEPVPSAFESLCDNVALNRVRPKVRCFNLAVGARPGTASFTSTLDTVNRVALAGDSDAGLIRVPVKTLDEIAGECRPAIVKIDVEGYETEVVSGADRVLSGDELFAVIMELNGAGAAYGFDEAALHRRMLDRGFRTFSYLPFDRRLVEVSREGSSAVNAIYVRNLELVTERVRTARAFSVLGREV